MVKVMAMGKENISCLCYLKETLQLEGFLFIFDKPIIIVG